MQLKQKLAILIFAVAKIDAFHLFMGDSVERLEKGLESEEISRKFDFFKSFFNNEQISFAGENGISLD